MVGTVSKLLHTHSRWLVLSLPALLPLVTCSGESENHRIIESLRLEKASKIIT